jgi:hypothetical protein
MPSYPIADDQSIRDGLDYLLSGPAGLGQNFQGFAGYEDPWAKNTNGDSDPKLPFYLTGNSRLPFTQQNPASLYVQSFALSNAEQLDDRTIRYTFASPQSPAPFSLGNGLSVTGITPSTYNSSSLKSAGYSIGQIGVVECTTTYVVVRTVAPITSALGNYVSGGTIGYSSTDIGEISTDCNARVTVTGGGDRVVVSGQLDQIVSYECFDPDVSFQVSVSIDRFIGQSNNDPVNPDFLFEQQFPPVINKTYTFTGLNGTGILPIIETVFAPVIDRPPIGYYWYILQIRYDLLPGGGYLEVTQDELRLRSLTALALKP